MKARLPKEYQNRGANNMNSMIKQAQKMQEDIERVQAELEARDFTASAAGGYGKYDQASKVAAGGMIEVTMSGAKVLKEVKLNPEVVDKDAIEDLQDVIVAGVNAVITQIEEVSAAEMEKVTGGVNIPGLV